MRSASVAALCIVGSKSMASSPSPPSSGKGVAPPPSGMGSANAAPRTHRLPLGASRRRISYERRLRLWLSALALPSLGLVVTLVYLQTASPALSIVSAVVFATAWAIASAYLFDQLVRPLQTLANVVAALREDDFSFRARGARRGDSLGDLALEINALAGTLQSQRSAARDALTLVERVMTSMQAPVFAFAPDNRLRLLNQAAEQAFRLARRSAVNRLAADLGLVSLLAIPDQGIYSPASPTADGQPAAVHLARWSVRRTTFRLHGIPHTLFVLSDVAAALREEERIAWQRLIRVLSHEINNSLTPIKSIAGSLRVRLPELGPASNLQDRESAIDFGRGLTVIEDRAASLNRFLQAYQQLTRLPAPQLRRVDLRALLEQVAALETRLPIPIASSPSVMLEGDADQLQQLLINLLRNAVEAASSLDAPRDSRPQVSVSWHSTPDHVTIQIVDNGPGLTNPANLFVPFYTTKPEGSGIGLVLAQQIASAHKGTLTLRNRIGETGCIAELRLPLQQL